jgi:retron-type reverse transcriptase
VGVRLSELAHQYRIFKDKKTRRFITEPVDQLALVHKRLLKLLCRIAPPEYVHSAIKKRSYKTNAEQHVIAENVLKIDIKKFFPSVKFRYIHDFFSSALHCSSDIATILTKLCTVQTVSFGVHLPTGSCLSPLLSFFANRRLFDSVKLLCDQHGCVFTVYIDDMTVSGEKASKELLTQIAIEIHNHGYQYHKIKTYHGAPAVVTGLVVSKGKLSIPHERIKKIRELRESLLVTKNPSLRSKMLASLVGRLSEAEQINPGYKKVRQTVMSTYAAEWDTVVAYRLRKTRVMQARLRHP